MGRLSNRRSDVKVLALRKYVRFDSTRYVSEHKASRMPSRVGVLMLGVAPDSRISGV